jgi:hypothetical protein
MKADNGGQPLEAADYFGIEDVISPDTPSFVAGVP